MLCGVCQEAAWRRAQVPAGVGSGQTFHAQIPLNAAHPPQAQVPPLVPPQAQLWTENKETPLIYIFSPIYYINILYTSYERILVNV